MRSTAPVLPSVPSGPVVVEVENLPRSPGADQHDKKWFVYSLNQNKVLLAEGCSESPAIILDYLKYE